MRVQVYYESGSCSTLDTTYLSWQDEMMADDTYLDATDMEERGLRIVRSTYMREEDGVEVESVRLGEPITIVSAEELTHVYAIVVDGLKYFVRLDGRLTCVAKDELLAEFAGN